MTLCPNCNKLGFCRFECTRLITKGETRDTRLVRIIRNCLLLLTDVYGLTPTRWLDFLHDVRRDLKTTVLSYEGKEITISLDALEPPEKLDAQEAKGLDFIEYEKALERKVKVFEENQRTYLDDLCCQPVPLNITPNVHEVNRAKFIAIATLVAAAFPYLCAIWPRHPNPSNDNKPSEEIPE